MPDDDNPLYKYLILGIDEEMRDDPILMRNFDDVARSMLTGYVRLAEMGMAPASVAAAMLSATVNLYEMFGMSRHLPDALRNLADEIESEFGRN